MTLIVYADVRYGIKNNESVRAFQRALTGKGYPCTADGWFGDKTRAACKAYQIHILGNVSGANGIPGPFTFHTLGLTDAGNTPPPLTPGEIDPHAVTFTRYVGSSSSLLLTDWINAACSAAGVMANEAWLRGYKTIAARESSGDPNACNLYDLNAITPAGYSRVRDYGNGYHSNGSISPIGGALTPFQCSRGVVQTIPQTFAKYHRPGTSLSIYSPVANIASSIGYVRDVYHVSSDGHDFASKVKQADPNHSPTTY